MSVENVNGLPCICSGLAFSGVNAKTPVLVMAASPLASTSRAVPKSSSLALPAPSTRIFEGLRSRWITWRPWT